MLYFITEISYLSFLVSFLYSSNFLDEFSAYDDF